MKIEQKKEMAKLLFVRENLSQKEIAEKVGVAEKTVSKWVNADDEAWKKERQSILITKGEQLRRIYEQIDELNTHIRTREEGKRFAMSKEADALVKLTAAANNLESEASVAEVIEVSRRFISWLRPLAPATAKEVASMFNDFIKDILKR